MLSGLQLDRHNRNISNRKLIIAQVNSTIPSIPNENLCIHASQVDVVVEVDEKIDVVPNIEPSELDKKVASYIVDMYRTDPRFK